MLGPGLSAACRTITLSNWSSQLPSEMPKWLVSPWCRGGDMSYWGRGEGMSQALCATIGLEKPRFGIPIPALLLAPPLGTALDGL